MFAAHAGDADLGHASTDAIQCSSSRGPCVFECSSQTKRTNMISRWNVRSCNVQRVYMQIKKLARMLLLHHYANDEKKLELIIDLLKYCSHNHMISRRECLGNTRQGP
jgi:hypothetical protein